MKKTITLIIALLTFVTGTQVAHAQTLNVIVESGMNINDQENSDVLLAINALVLAGQIEYVPLSDEVTGVTSTKTGKLLFSGTNDGFIIVSADVTTSDDIYYIITDADRAVFEEAGMDEMMRPYRSIKMHFVPGSGGNIDKAALIGTIKNGMNLEDSEYTWMAIVALTQYFNQIKMEYELDEDGEFTGGISYSSKDDKLLFLDKNNIITIADGVTSADDIIYTITQEDRDRLLEEAPEAYTYFANYETIQLHFNVEIVEPKVEAVMFDVSEITLHPGQELQLEPRFTPENVEDKTLRYVDISGGHNVYIDSDNGIIFAQSEGVAYIQAFSSYTASGEEVMALWGPTQEIYLKINITALGPGEEIFFDYKEGEGTDAPTISCHVLKNEQTDMNNYRQTCEIAGPYNEDDITTQAIPEWRTGTVNIPEEAMGYEVVRVGAYAFYECQISTLYIPWTVTQIGYNACAYNDYLTDVYIYSFKPLQFTDAYGDPMEESMGHNDAFSSIGEGDDGEGYATLHVPAGCKAAWDVYPWNEWFRYIVEDAPIPDGINEMKSEELRMKNEGSWFDLSGRKLGSKPTKPGLYINGGKKVVIK